MSDPNALPEFDTPRQTALLDAQATSTPLQLENAPKRDVESRTGIPENTLGMYALNSVNHTDLFTLCDGLQDQSVDMILCDLPYGLSRCKNIFRCTLCL